MTRTTILTIGIGMLLIPSPQQPAPVTVRHPATTVRILGDEYLVHEVWVANTSAHAATMDSVVVLDGSRVVRQYAGEELRRHVGRPGLLRNHPTPLLLEPGQQAVVYFWIPIRNRPVNLSHRAALTLSDSAPKQVWVTGGEAAVSTADVEVIDPPLRGKDWATVYEPSMMGGHRTAIYTTDGHDRIPGRFAIDFIRILPTGRVHTDTTTRPDDWNGFGAEVLAVKSARVAAAVDGRPDRDRFGTARETITRENAAGNYIALDLGNGRFAFYEHLQQGSVQVKVGDQVASGQMIARVGSSGSVSSGPHLHFHLSNGNSLLGAEGIPFVIREFRLQGAFRSIAELAGGAAYVPNADGLAAQRMSERPGPNAVVEFRGR